MIPPRPPEQVLPKNTDRPLPDESHTPWLGAVVRPPAAPRAGSVSLTRAAAAVVQVCGAILRAGFVPPARWLGVAGLLLVAALLVVPALAAYGAAWRVPATLAAVAWLAMAATQVDPSTYRLVRYRLLSTDLYVLGALERRDALAAEWTRIKLPVLRRHVAGMLRRIDTEVLPDLDSRVKRHRALVHALRRLDEGQGPLAGASSEHIAALRERAAGQREALDDLLARLADMNAIIAGVTEDAQPGDLVAQTEAWIRRLRAYWEATGEVFRTPSRYLSPDSPEPG